jgi:hypothetical protein
VSLDTIAYHEAAEQHFSDTGATLPGHEAQPAREAFSVKFKAE